ncbi:glycosyltransferase [Frigoribacterium sp. CFBP9030]|uniref:glycosyltransferase n=1 Tax=Frigoribacterium sp. CFBP9030 TaxID=3096537 RepID=UPI002A6A8411|nr:glycosyltransferase [Frigoribacterium sp. CFBP9030]
MTIAHNFAPLVGPSVVFVHDLLFEDHPEWFSASERAYFALMPLTLGFADVVVTSTAVESRRIERLHPGLAPVGTIGLAVPRNLAAAESRRPDEDLRPGGFVLCVGRLNARKNLETVIRGVALSNSVDADAPLVVVGSAEHSGAGSDLSDDFRALRDAGHLRFLGRVDDEGLKWLYENARVTVYLSRDEGFGLPPIEATAFGSPVIVSDIPVLHETLGDSAQFVDPSDAVELAAALDELDGDPGRPKSSGSMGVRHSWADTTERLRRSLPWGRMGRGETRSARPDRRILYYRIHDSDYPRNRLIREHLGSRPVDIRIVPKSSRSGKLRRMSHDLGRLFRNARGADVIIVAEMSLTHVPFAWLASRLVRARLVVDGFVGLHETAIGDWKLAAAHSFRARRLAFQDWLAIQLADVYLTDTRLRADLIRARKRTSGLVDSLPVGAPAWARPAIAPRASGPLRVLYYGNYIPLHGLDLVVESLALAYEEREMAVTFIGEGDRRAAVEKRVAESGLGNVVAFRDSVPERELFERISESDVVLGIFGGSAKAQSVIANKVWQGLACERLVITQRSEALAELRNLVGRHLLETDPGSARSLADALVSATPSAGDGTTTHRLSAYVEGEFSRVVGEALDTSGGSRA